jgi:hypothetical protein
VPHTNNSAAMATVLPQGTPISQNDVPAADEAWYRVVVTPGQTSLGFFAWGTAPDFGAEVLLFDGSGGPGALVDMPTANNSWTGSNDRRPIQFTVVGVSEVFVKVIPNDDGVLHVSVVAGPEEGSAPGDILINDDSVGFPMAVLDPTDGHVKQLVHPIVAGEAGDSLATGLVVFHDFDTDHIAVYDSADWSLVADLTPANVGDRILRTNRSLDRVYVLSHGGPGVITIQWIDNTGALDATVRTGSRTGTVRGLATSPDGTLAYYAQGGGAIRVLDLVADVQLSDLVAAPGDATLSWDMLGRSNGDLLIVRYRLGITGVKVHRYSNAGVELEIHDFGDVWIGPGGGTPPRLAYDPTAPDDAYWIMLHNEAPLAGWTTLYKVATIGGAWLTTIVRPEYELGVWEPAETLTPAERFGNSFSCPLVLLHGEGDDGDGDGGGGADPGAIGPIAWVLWPRTIP